MPKIVAVVPVDPKRSRLGLPSRCHAPLAGRTVLAHTVSRLCRVPKLSSVVLLHGEGPDPLQTVNGAKFTKPLSSCAGDAGWTDAQQGRRRSARKWSLGSWRGGLGGMTCFDEMLPAAPLLEAVRSHDADAALIVGGDWPLVDPELCRRLIEQHLDSPEAYMMTFSQAPPGLGGIVVGRKLLEDLTAQTAGSIGGLMAYHPSRPQADPIGRDLCVQIDASVRSCLQRFVCDTPRSADMINLLAEQLGDRFDEADAATVTALATKNAEQLETSAPHLPRLVTLELTPQRDARLDGPLVPQGHVRFDRAPMELGLALRIVRQLGAEGDIALTLGGLGDALQHPHWQQIVEAAHEAGVLGIAVETDLLVEPAQALKLLDLPIDVVSVRLNADTDRTYRVAMAPGTNGEGPPFATVVGHLETLMNRCAARRREGSDRIAPWIVTRLAKTTLTMGDMESFFDRWTHFAGHAVIEAATPGRGRDGDLMPDLSTVPMSPPLRTGCRQLEQRMTILSNGRVAQCDQDWLGEGTGGNAAEADLSTIWKDTQNLRLAHAEGRWNEIGLCGGCRQWHRA